MALAAIEHPTSLHLLADAVDLVQAAAGRRAVLTDATTVGCLRALLRDLLASADELEEALVRPAPPPTTLTVVSRADAGGGRTPRPGSLRVTTAGREVRVEGRGPAAEGDLVRAALHQRAGAAGSEAQERLGGLLWTALVAMSQDGLEPPTALPSPLGQVGRTR